MLKAENSEINKGLDSNYSNIIPLFDDVSVTDNVHNPIGFSPQHLTVPKVQPSSPSLLL